MRRVSASALVLALLCLISLVRAQVANAGATGSITVTASESAFVDLRFTSPWAISSPILVRSGGSGRFVGVFADRLAPDGQPMLAGDGLPYDYADVRFKSGGTQSWPPGLGCGAPDCRNPAGVYRLYILSDTPVTMSIPVVGSGRHVSTVAKTSVHPRLRELKLSPALSPGLANVYATSGTFTVTIGRSSVAIGSVIEKPMGGVVGNDTVTMCIQARDCPTATDVFADPRMNVNGSPGSPSASIYTLRGYYPSGPSRVVATCRSMQPWSSCTASVLDQFLVSAPPRRPLSA